MKTKTSVSALWDFYVPACRAISLFQMVSGHAPAPVRVYQQLQVSILVLDKKSP
jgi:hypothetical protein